MQVYCCAFTAIITIEVIGLVVSWFYLTNKAEWKLKHLFYASKAKGVSVTRKMSIQMIKFGLNCSSKIDLSRKYVSMSKI